MLTIVDVLEGSGMPPLVVAVATASNQNRVLGEILAEAVKVQAIFNACFQIELAPSFHCCMEFVALQWRLVCM